MKWQFSIPWFCFAAVSSAAIGYQLSEPESVPVVDAKAHGTGESAQSNATPKREAVAWQSSPSFDEPEAPPAPLTQRSLAELRGDFVALVRSGRQNSSDYEQLITELVAQGEAGVAVALDLLGESGLDFPFRGRCFAQAFAGCEDERIFPAVMQLLREYQSEGLTSFPFRNGYFGMLAEHGGAEGARYLWDRLREDGQDFVAAGALVASQESLALDLVLSELGTPDSPMTEAVAKALASWGDPRVEQRLVELAVDPWSPSDFREAALVNVGRHCDVERASELIDLFWTAGDDGADRALYVGTLRGIGENHRMERETKAVLAEPVLLEALARGDKRLQAEAVSAVADCAAFQTAEVETAIGRLFDLSAGAERERLKLVLGRIRKHRD